MRVSFGKMIILGFLTYFVFQNRYALCRWLIGWAGLRHFLKSNHIRISVLTNWVDRLKAVTKS